MRVSHLAPQWHCSSDWPAVAEVRKVIPARKDPPVRRAMQVRSVRPVLLARPGHRAKKARPVRQARVSGSSDQTAFPGARYNVRTMRSWSPPTADRHAIRRISSVKGVRPAGRCPAPNLRRRASIDGAGGMLAIWLVRTGERASAKLPRSHSHCGRIRAVM